MGRRSITILWKVGLPQPKSSSERPLCMAKVLMRRFTSSCSRIALLSA